MSGNRIQKGGDTFLILVISPQFIPGEQNDDFIKGVLINLDTSKNWTGKGSQTNWEGRANHMNIHLTDTHTHTIELNRFDSRDRGS